MANPFGDKTSTAEARALENMRGRVNELDDEKRTERDISDLGEVGSGAMPGEEAVEISFDQTDEPASVREDKKSNRYQEAWDGKTRAEAKAEVLEAENMRLRVQVSATPAPQLAPQQPQADPYEEKLEDLFDKRTALYDSYTARRASTTPPTPAEEKDFMRKARKLEVEQQETIARKVMGPVGAPRQSAQQAQQQALNARHYDVMSDSRAQQWADGEYKKRLAMGESASVVLYDTVMDETRKQFRIGPYREGGIPDPDHQRRYTGSSAARGGAGGGAPKPKSIIMTGELKRIADHAYPHIKDEKKRHTKWATTAGPGYLRAERERGRG